jgi:hypothetical protein
MHFLWKHHVSTPHLSKLQPPKQNLVHDKNPFQESEVNQFVAWAAGSRLAFKLNTTFSRSDSIMLTVSDSLLQVNANRDARNHEL